MQRLAELAQAQLTGLNEPVPHGTQRLERDSVIHLGALLRQMSGAFPHQEYDAATTRIFLLAFEDLALEFGLSELEVALRRFLTRQKFFPHPSEVREELDAMARQKQKEQTTALPKLGCELCEGSGMPGFTFQVSQSGDRAMVACSCYHARKKAETAVKVEHDWKAKAALNETEGAA